MADIRLTAGDDAYQQPIADKDAWNNVFGEAGNDTIRLYNGIGIGGITTIDDVMEFLVAGASAVQIGTANFFNPQGAMLLPEQLDRTLEQVGAKSVAEMVGTLQTG